MGRPEIARARRTHAPERTCVRTRTRAYRRCRAHRPGRARRSASAARGSLTSGGHTSARLTRALHTLTHAHTARTPAQPAPSPTHSPARTPARSVDCFAHRQAPGLFSLRWRSWRAVRLAMRRATSCAPVAQRASLCARRRVGRGRACSRTEQIEQPACALRTGGAAEASARARVGQGAVLGAAPLQGVGRALPWAALSLPA